MTFTVSFDPIGGARWLFSFQFELHGNGDSGVFALCFYRWGVYVEWSR